MIFPSKLPMYSCPLCDSITEKKEWVMVTHANQYGEPVEESGKAYYCTNEECEHNTEPIDND